MESSPRSRMAASAPEIRPIRRQSSARPPMTKLQSAVQLVSTDESNNSIHKVEEEHHTKCYTWMVNHRLGWLARIPGEWPRTIALIFGVVIPLFVLIAVSLFFGYGLAKLEAPNEIETNNAIIANRALIATAAQFQGNVTKELPRICLEILASNSTDSIFSAMEQELDEIFLQVLDRKNTSLDENDTSIEITDETLPNSTLELLDFMANCGTLGFDMANRFTSLAIEQEYVGDDLTFNWIRCDGLGKNETTSLGDQIWGRPFVNRSRLQPDVQAADAVAAWRQDARVLYDQVLEEILASNTTGPINARIQAYEYSVDNANGFEHCYANSASGAWFWFTVMTTIGYGNCAPATNGGRAMVYTLGFFSILLFAIILGTAGTIVVTIWDDVINRTKLEQFNIAWVACIFWGCLYYAWMLVIAAVTQNWKADRLGEDMLFKDAYWFSYISTTTVGLGDYYLENDVILREDLFTFPVLFLTGFVLLANFFVKLTEVISNLVPHNRPTLEETLATSDTPCLPKMPHKRLVELSMKQKARFKAYAYKFSIRSHEHEDHDDDDDELHAESSNEMSIVADNDNDVSAEAVESTDCNGSSSSSPRASESVPAVESGDGSPAVTAAVESAVP